MYKVIYGEASIQKGQNKLYLNIYIKDENYIRINGVRTLIKNASTTKGIMILKVAEEGAE